MKYKRYILGPTLASVAFFTFSMTAHGEDSISENLEQKEAQFLEENNQSLNSFDASAQKLVSSEEAADAPLNNSTEEPSGEAADVPLDNSTEEPSGEAADVPLDNSTEEPSGEAADAPLDNSTEEPSGEAADVPLDNSTEEPSGEAADAPLDYSTEEPSGEAADVPLDNSTEEPSAEAADVPLDNSTEEPSAEAADVPLDNSTEEPSAEAAGDPLDNSTEEPSAEAAGDPLENSTEEPSAEAAGDPLENSTEEPSAEADSKKANELTTKKEQSVGQLLLFNKSTPLSFSLQSVSTPIDSKKTAVFNKNAKAKIYSKLSDRDGEINEEFMYHTFFTNKKAEKDGQTYYSLLNDLDGEFLGWVSENDLSIFDLGEEKKHKVQLGIKDVENVITTVPYGRHTQWIDTAENLGSHIFDSEKSIQVGKLSYYYGKVNNTYGWINSNYTTALKNIVPVRTENRNVATFKKRDNDGFYRSIYNTDSFKIDSSINHSYFTMHHGKFKGQDYYNLYNDIDGSFVGWVKASELNLEKLSSTVSHKKKYGIIDIDKKLTSVASGRKDQEVGSFKQLGSHIFDATKKVKVGNENYYYGIVGNTKGWINEDNITDFNNITISRTKEENSAKFKNKDNDGFYRSIYNTQSFNIDTAINHTYFTKHRGTFKDEIYYDLYNDINGSFVGWVRENDLQLEGISSYRPSTKTFKINNLKSYIYDVPNGSPAQIKSSLATYESSKFQAEKTVKIGNDYYYFGIISNQRGWINENDISNYYVTNKKYDISLDRAVDIQMNLRAKPQAWVSGGGWRNATRSEVEQYLNPANHTTETWDYTYLDLNRAQNISSTELNNKLLNGKGILHNQGTAFLQAVNTHGVNEVYLISHALHETGNGQSTLAQGVRLDANGNISENGKFYYNMYGIAAYDHNPVLEGARYAQRMGWDTPAKAVIGGAQFISSGYFNRGQNTLYAMRWNPANPGTYQYATDVNWAYATARNLQNYYDQLGLQGQYYTRYTF